MQNEQRQQQSEWYNLRSLEKTETGFEKLNIYRK